MRIIAKMIDVKSGKVRCSVKVGGYIESDNPFNVVDRVASQLFIKAQGRDFGDITVPYIANEKKAIRTLKRRRIPVSAIQWYSKGMKYYYTHPKKAVKYLKRAITEYNEYIDALLNIGYLLSYTFNKYEDAMYYLTRAANILKQQGKQKTKYYADTMYNIGVVYWSKGEYDKALRYYF